MKELWAARGRFYFAVKRGLSDRWGAYLSVLWLPLFLVVLITIQTHIFIYWADSLRTYSMLRTIAALGSGFLLVGPSVMFGRLGRHIYLFAVTLLTATVFVSQFLYYSYAGSFIQASALKYGGQALALGGSLKVLPINAIFFFSVGPLVVLISFALIGQSRISLSRKGRKVLMGCLIAFGLLGYVYSGWKEYQHWGTLARFFGTQFDSRDIVQKLGIQNYSLIEVFKYSFKKKGVSEVEKQFVIDWADNQPAAPSEPSRFFGDAAGRNLIFIQLESFQNFPIGVKVGNQEVTPVLNQLAKEGYYFANHHYQSGPGTTADAEFATLNSLYPPMTEVPFFEFPKNNYNALPELLKNQGYGTYAFHGDEKTFWNRSAAYPALGIDRYYNIDDYHVPRSVGFGKGLLDSDFFGQTSAHLQQLKQPFMAYAATLTSHTPFELPPDLRGLELDHLNISDYQKNYLQSVHYVDKALGEFIGQLKQSGLYERSLIVINGDHQGAIAKQDDKAFAAFLGSPNGFDDLGFLQSTRVPMVFLVPGKPVQGVSNKPTTHLDIYPTIAELLGTTSPRGVLGRSMFGDQAGIVVRRASNGGVGSVLSDQWVYFAASGDKAEQCLDLNRKVHDLGVCLPEVQRQAENIRVSDIVIRGNLLRLIQ